MAYRGNNNGGGCLIYIMIFILIFLPPLFTGGPVGIQGYLVWWIIVGLVYLGIDLANSPTTSNYTSFPTQRTTSDYDPKTCMLIKQSDNPEACELLKVSSEYLNKSVMSGYFSKIQLRDKLEKSRERLEEEQRNIEKQIEEKKQKQQDLREGVGKSILTSKKKWLLLKQPEIESLEHDITDLEEKYRENEIQINQSDIQIGKLKFNIFDEMNSAFDELKIAFEKVKKSCKVSGKPNFVELSISNSQRENDFKYIKYKTAPYELMMDNYRFYFFPNSIWVFEDEEKLVGVYKPKALKGSLETKEIKKESYYGVYSDKPEVYSDTKIITKDFFHHTWLHTCRDGTPDRRYTYNPIRTYSTKQDYYVLCSFNLDLCGCKLKYAISSYDNCKILEEAINNYSNIRENKDMIPIFLDLLERCIDNQDVENITIIREKCRFDNGGINE